MSVLAPTYGKLPGLRARLVDWHDRLRKSGSGIPAIGDAAAGSFWGGLIADLGAVMQILNLREFAEHLRVNGDETQRRFAGEILAADETLEAVQCAADRADALEGVEQGTDPVRVIELLDEKARAATCDYDAVRRVLVDVGALGADDTDTPVADLVRALLS